jgi:Trypsin-like peptidase domain
MMILDALQTILVSVLVSYLSLTGSLAEYVQSHIVKTGDTLTEEQEESVPNITTHEPTEELALFSRLFASSGVSRFLFENNAFQEAAQGVGEAANTIAPLLTKETAMQTVEDSLVNIFCEYKTDTYTRTTTGTGFFIHEQGVILSNAHVAQFLLLESVDENVNGAECVVRSGNPATPRYRAELLFISPTWIFNNAKLISTEHPRGTGEYDYALLYIAESLDGTPLPSTYPTLPINTEFLSKNTTGSTVITAGYPAEKLSREGPRATLIPEVARTSIQELYTFGSNYADIFSITESPVGEQGASGGPVVDETLGTIGLIVTKGDMATEGARSLRALTLSYIDRTIREETGYSLIQNASGNVEFRGQVFKDALAPFLTKLLTYELVE